MKIRWVITVIAGLCGLAMLSTVAIGRISGGEISGGGGGGRATFAAMVRDPLSFFAMRSPGDRGGALLSSKPARASSETPPTERVLSSVRERPPVELASAPPEFPAAGIIPIENILPSDFLQAPALGPAPESALIGFMPPIVGLPAGGYSSGDGGGGLEGGTQPAEPTPVPEPATWATMILGFFVIGSSIRRARARLARPKAGCAEQA